MVKKKGWNLTKLVTAGSFGVLLILLLLPGIILSISSGFAVLGGAINIFIYPIVIVICLLLLDQFGAATIMLTIMGVLTIPLPHQGPPGFIPKVIILFIGGLIADIMYLLLRKNKLIASLLVSGPVIWWFGIAISTFAQMFDFPGMEQIIQIVLTPFWFISLLLIGSLSGFFGYVIYNKIKNTSIVKRIQR